MSKEHKLENIVDDILQVWNKNCSDNGVDKVYLVTTNFRSKKIKFADKENKVFEGTVNIGELCLTESINSGTLTKLIYRTEVPSENLPPKNYKGNEYAWKELNNYQVKTSLYNSFLYECIGTFCATTTKFFNDKQIAEYDLDLDRLKGDDLYKGVFIEVDKASDEDWFKVGDKYEVFTQTQSNNWGVYSYRQDHKNGIGQIPLTHAKIVKENKEEFKVEICETREQLNKIKKVKEIVTETLEVKEKVANKLKEIKPKKQRVKKV
jgi:hypothetical protein